jgi:hypothetical protein
VPGQQREKAVRAGTPGVCVGGWGAEGKGCEAVHPSKATQHSSTTQCITCTESRRHIVTGNDPLIWQLQPGAAGPHISCRHVLKRCTAGGEHQVCAWLQPRQCTLLQQGH